MAQGRADALVGRASLELWRPPVRAALQPVLLLDAALGLEAVSAAARRLLGIGRSCRPLAQADQLARLAADDDAWDAVPCVRALRTGRAHSGAVVLAGGASVEVVASPLFGPAGVIGATAFLSAR